MRTEKEIRELKEDLKQLATNFDVSDETIENTKNTISILNWVLEESEEE